MHHGGQVVFQIGLGLLALRQDHIVAQESMDDFVTTVGQIAAAGDDISELIETAFSVEITGQAFIGEVATLRRKFRTKLLAEQRQNKRRTIEYHEAQRRANRSRNPVSVVASQVESSALQTKSVLADFAQLQQNLTDFTAKMKEHVGEDYGEPPPPVAELWRGEVAIEEAHLAVLGLRGLGADVARQLAQLGVAKITLVDHRICTKEDVERGVLHPEHIDMQLIAAVALKMQGFCDAAGYATVIDTAAISISSPESHDVLYALLKEDGQDGYRSVDATFVCLDGAAALMSCTTVCNLLARPYAEITASNDGARGHVHLRVPGGGPCGLCAAALPDFLGHAADPFGDGMALMFAASTRRLVVALAVQQVCKGLTQGVWAACSTEVDSRRGVVSKPVLADENCKSSDCTRLQKFYRAFQSAGKRMQLQACDQDRGWQTVTGFTQAEDAEIAEALGYTEVEVTQLRNAIKR